MVTPGQDASIALTFTARDNASPAIQRLGGNLSRLSSAAASVGKVLAANTATFLTAALALSSIGAQASQLGVKFGLLTEKQGDFLNTAFQVTAVVLGTAAVLAQLTQTLGGTTASILKGTTALILFASWAAVVLGIVTTLVTAFQLLNDPANLTTIEKLFGVRLPTFDRPGEAPTGAGRLGGAAVTGLTAGAVDLQELRDSVEFINRNLLRIGLGGFGPRGGGGGGGQPVIINNGTIIADENGIRSLETRLRRVRKEDERARGITK